MSLPIPIRDSKHSLSSSASVHSTDSDATSANTPKSKCTDASKTSQSSVNSHEFTADQTGARGANAQQTTSSRITTEIASSSDTNRNLPEPTLPKIHVPPLATVLQNLRSIDMHTITFDTRRELGTDLTLLSYFSASYELSLPEGLSPSVKQLSLLLDPLLKNSLNTPPTGKMSVEWPLRRVTAEMEDGSSTCFRALVLGRLILNDDENIRNHTHWIVAISTDYSNHKGNHLFALRAARIAEDEMLDERDFELYEEDIPCRYSAFENLFGPAKDGLMYYLGPLSLLDSDNGQVGKAEPLYIKSWTSEDIDLKENGSE